MTLTPTDIPEEDQEIEALAKATSETILKNIEHDEFLDAWFKKYAGKKDVILIIEKNETGEEVKKEITKIHFKDALKKYAELIIIDRSQYSIEEFGNFNDDLLGQVNEIFRELIEGPDLLPTGYPFKPEQNPTLSAVVGLQETVKGIIKMIKNN